MLFTSILRFLPAAILLIGVQGTPLDQEKRQTSIDGFVKSQVAVSIKGVLANIGADGSKAQGASAGIVVASPSRSNPDCMYIVVFLVRVSTDTPQTGTPGHEMPL
jgi:glucoamylase